MLDPFPIPSPPLLRRLAAPMSSSLALTTLPLHLHEIILAAVFYHIICSAVSPALSARLFPHVYPHLARKTRLHWDVHVVSLVQCLTILAFAFYILAADKERAVQGAAGWAERVWGYTGAQGLLQALAAGYFLWDLVVCAVYPRVFGVGLLAHAMSALSVYLLGFRPFVNYYGTIFILYECSSPFLNFHWFFDKLGMTGSLPQLVNGILLITVFFCCRLVWGLYGTICVFKDIWHAMRSRDYTLRETRREAFVKAATDPREEIMRYAGSGRIPLWLPVVYLTSNMVLNCLNVYWFSKMIETVRRRFDPPLGTRKVEKETGAKDADVDMHLDGNADVQVQRGVYADGRKTVEVEATEIRQRPLIQREISSLTDMM